MLKPAAEKASLVVCSTCRFPDGRKQDAQGRSGGEVLAQQLAAALEDHPCRGALALQVMPCLFACNVACNVHLRSHGRMGYILGKFEPVMESARALLDYAAHYLATTDGVVPYALWPNGIKGHFLVRILPEGAVWESFTEETRRQTVSLTPQNPQDHAFKTGLWLILLAGASVATTFALACATPVAAFAALAALYMGRTQGTILMAVVWLAGQAVGFGFLHYPLGAATLVWSTALLICAFFTLEVAMIVARQAENRGPTVRAIAAIATAMIAFKIAIYLFGIVLGGNAGAFASAVVFKFAWTNLASFIFLLVLHRIAMTVGLVAQSGPFAVAA